MPRIPQLPRSRRRLFGRVDRFTLECPRCGELVRAHFTNVGHVRRMEAARPKPTTSTNTSTYGRGQPAASIYNPLTQRMTCPKCRRVWAIGLIVYPVRQKANPKQPYDTRPTWKQLLAIRQLSGAVYLDKPIAGRDSVNVLIETTCSCTEGEPAPMCPVHGWVEQLEEEDPDVPRGELETLRAECKRLAWENKQLRNIAYPVPENVLGDPLAREADHEPLDRKSNK